MKIILFNLAHFVIAFMIIAPLLLTFLYFLNKQHNNPGGEENTLPPYQNPSQPPTKQNN